MRHNPRPARLDTSSENHLTHVTFLLSKLLWIVAEPGNFAAGLFLIAVPFLWTRWHRWARYPLLALALTLAFVGTFRAGDWLLRPLEFRFPVPPLPGQVDGIVLLGGFLNPPVSRWRHEPTLTPDATRLVTFLTLANKYPRAKLVFTGGNSSVSGRGPTEADVMRHLLDDIGFDQTRMIYENRARNTYENAALTKALIKPEPQQTWLLITSAANIPRAVGCFRQVGWDVIPYPTDYKGDLATFVRTGMPIGAYLDEISLALHEWIGLAVYRVLGRTDALFPRPH
jgi:uncharacterized SAM-binding protein YcdF (DUF218 family)